MNPFANPEEAIAYTYDEFPKAETPAFEFSSFDQELSGEPTASTFVDFLHFDSSTSSNDAPVVQTAIFQDFKEVLLPAEG